MRIFMNRSTSSKMSFLLFAAECMQSSGPKEYIRD
jgi:hypothetical protein